MTATTTLAWTEVTNVYADCKAATMLQAVCLETAYDIVRTNGGRYRVYVGGKKLGGDVGGAGALRRAKDEADLEASLRAEKEFAAAQEPAAPVGDLVEREPHLGEVEAVGAVEVIPALDMDGTRYHAEPTAEDVAAYAADQAAGRDVVTQDGEYEAAVAAWEAEQAADLGEAETVAAGEVDEPETVPFDVLEEDKEWESALDAADRRAAGTTPAGVPVVFVEPDAPAPVKAKKAKAPKADDGFGPDGWKRPKANERGKHKSGRAEVDAERDAAGNRLASRGRGYWLAWVDGTQLPGKFDNMKAAQAAALAAMG